MTVTKDNFEAYRIQANGEWATICLRTWSRQVNDGKDIYHCGEILIHSSFGNFNNAWTACGVPFKRFLVGIGWDYFMEKCGCKVHVYDGEGTLRNIRGEILRRRRSLEFSKSEAREVWEAVAAEADEIVRDIHSMVNGILTAANSCVMTADCEGFFQEPWRYARTMDNPMATGFWKCLWPEFEGALRMEIDAVADARVAA